MAQDAWHARSWRDKLHVLVARTGWRPADVAERYPRPKTDLAHFHKFDPHVGGAVRGYALAQLVVVLAVGVALLFVPDQGRAANALFVGLMLLTMVCTTRWLDGYRGVGLELARLALVAALAGLAWRGGFAPALLIVAVAYVLLNLLVLPLLQRVAGSDPGAALAAD
jgi:hypothetical protein